MSGDTRGSLGGSTGQGVEVVVWRRLVTQHGGQQGWQLVGGQGGGGHAWQHGGAKEQGNSIFSSIVWTRFFKSLSLFTRFLASFSGPHTTIFFWGGNYTENLD